MLLLLLVYLHVDVPLDFEGLGTFFTGSLHALSTIGLTEVWCLEEYSQSCGYQYTFLPMIVFSIFLIHSYVAHAELTMHYL